jgi:predicted TIM-barrel enzyme
VSFQKLFPEKPLVGMIHMPPLPGAPSNTKSIKELTEFALSEADKLEVAASTPA